MGLRLDSYPFLVKHAFANFSFNMTEDASNLVKSKLLDLSVTSLDTLAYAPNFGKKFHKAYDWSGLSKVDSHQIIQVVLNDNSLSKVIKPEANNLNVHRRLLHDIVCNIILPMIGKFEYLTFLDLFVMYSLITHTPMNLGHLILNHMNIAFEKKK